MHLGSKLLIILTSKSQITCLLFLRSACACSTRSGRYELMNITKTECRESLVINHIYMQYVKWQSKDKGIFNSDLNLLNCHNCCKMKSKRKWQRLKWVKTVLKIHWRYFVTAVLVSACETFPILFDDEFMLWWSWFHTI